MLFSIDFSGAEKKLDELKPSHLIPWTEKLVTFINNISTSNSYKFKLQRTDSANFTISCETEDDLKIIIKGIRQFITDNKSSMPIIAKGMFDAYVEYLEEQQNEKSSKN